MLLTAAFAIALLSAGRDVGTATLALSVLAPVALIGRLAAEPTTGGRRWATLVAWPLLVGLLAAFDATALRSTVRGNPLLYTLVALTPVAAGVFAVLTLGDRRATRLSPAASRSIAGGLWGVLAVALAALAVAAAAAFEPGDDAAVLAFFLMPVAGAVGVGGLVLITQARVGLRRRRAAVVVAYLEQAVRTNLPLPRLLAAAGRSEPRGTADRLDAVRAELEAGRPIADAVRSAVPEVSPRAAALIAAGDRVGRLPAALHRLVAEQRHRHVEDSTERAYVTAYPVAVLSLAAFVTMLVCVFILPKFAQILHDFHAATPWPMRVLVGLTDVLPWEWLVLLIGAGAVAASMVRGRRWLFAPLHRRRDMADAFRVAADATDAGEPLDAAVRLAAGLPVHAGLGAALGRWADGMAAGQTPADGARAAGLPPLVSGLVATSAGPAVGDAVRFLARHYSARHDAALQVVRRLAVPAVAVSLGAVVTVLALAVFLPLVNLIDAANTFGGGR